MVNYNPWPIGHIPKELQRPDLDDIKQMGYYFQDARDVVRIFENKVARFTGANHAIAVDCCTHALELSLLWKRSVGQIKVYDEIVIPENTYASVPMVIGKAGFNVRAEAIKWRGTYELKCKGTRVIDAAVRWIPGMYEAETLMCLSFQIKKRIPIGRGGMILTDNKEAAEWLRLARYDGRDMSVPYDHPDHVKMVGYHYYMTPEDAARGIMLMDIIKECGDSADWTNYPNLKQWLKL